MLVSHHGYQSWECLSMFLLVCNYVRPCKMGELLKGDPCNDFKWAVTLNWHPPPRVMVFTINYPLKTLQYWVRKRFHYPWQENRALLSHLPTRKWRLAEGLGGKADAWEWQGGNKSGNKMRRHAWRSHAVQDDNVTRIYWWEEIKPHIDYDYTVGCYRDEWCPIWNLNAHLIHTNPPDLDFEFVPS